MHFDRAFVCVCVFVFVFHFEKLFLFFPNRPTKKERHKRTNHKTDFPFVIVFLLYTHTMSLNIRQTAVIA